MSFIYLDNHIVTFIIMHRLQFENYNLLLQHVMTVLPLNLSNEYVEFLVIFFHLNKICTFINTDFLKNNFIYVMGLNTIFHSWVVFILTKL